MVERHYITCIAQKAGDFVVAAKKEYDIEFNTDARDVSGKRPRECTPMTGFIPPF